MFRRKAFSWGGSGCPNSSTHLPPGIKWSMAGGGGYLLLSIKAAVHVILKLATWLFIMSGLITLSPWIQLLQKRNQPFELGHENRDPTRTCLLEGLGQGLVLSCSLHLLPLPLWQIPHCLRTLLKYEKIQSNYTKWLDFFLPKCYDGYVIEYPQIIILSIYVTSPKALGKMKEVHLQSWNTLFCRVILT